MTLILTIRNQDTIQDGVVAAFAMQGDTAVIGRSKNCDWTLPDASNIISSRHCEIRRLGDSFIVTDISTNGAYLNGANERMARERLVEPGDSFRIGHYDIVASFGEAASTAASPPAPASPAPPTPLEQSAPDAGAGWIGEDSIVAGVAPPSPPPIAAPPPPGPGPAESPREPSTPPPAPAAAISPTPAPPAPTPSAAAAAETPADDAVPEDVAMMWDEVTGINRVDWARGGLGDASPPVAAGPADDPSEIFLAALTLTSAEVKPTPELVGKGASMLRRLVSGLLVMVEARARAKAQMGIDTTQLQLDGNNPIKFARSPEQALAQLLSEPAEGFLDSDKAVDDAYLDLQSHQVATLAAIPGALRATLDRFSPGSIRRRAQSAGVLARLLPALHDAALWRNYEREYVKVKNESDEAFMEVFAKEFRKAYERELTSGFGDLP